MSFEAFSAWKRAGFKQGMRKKLMFMMMSMRNQTTQGEEGEDGGPLVEDVWWREQYGALTVVKCVWVIQAAELL